MKIITYVSDFFWSLFFRLKYLFFPGKKLEFRKYPNPRINRSDIHLMFMRHQYKPILNPLSDLTLNLIKENNEFAQYGFELHGWIDVRERLPHPNEDVIVFNDKNECYIAHMGEDGSFWTDLGLGIDVESWELNKTCYKVLNVCFWKDIGPLPVKE